MSTYNPSIPQATDLISNSQAQILTNFGQLNTQFGVDHSAFNTGSANGTGFHTKVTLVQGADATAVASANVIYTKAAGGFNELFMRRSTGDGSGIIQMTTGQPYFSSNANQSEVSSFLPGPPGSSGIILKAGKVNITAVGSWTAGTITFLTAFPNNCYSATITPVRGTSTPHSMYINNAALTAASFQIRSDDNAWNNVYYFAMGN